MISLNAHEAAPISSKVLEWIQQNVKPTAEELKKQRARCFDLFGFDSASTRLMPTFSGAAAIEAVLWSVFWRVCREEGKTQIITSAMEDAPTLQMLKTLEGLGCLVKIAPVNQMGQIDLKALQELVSSRTALITCTAAPGLTGVIQPIEELIDLAEKRGVLLHIEGSYTAGKYRFPMADYVTFRGDLWHGPKNSGGIFWKNIAPFAPCTFDLKEEDPALLCMLGIAASQATLAFDMASLEMARLKGLFEETLLKRLPQTRKHFEDVMTLPNTMILEFPQVHQKALYDALKRRNVWASVGGAYHQSLEPLLSLSQIEGKSALSFSFHRMHTEAEIISGVDEIVYSVKRLAALSEDL